MDDKIYSAAVDLRHTLHQYPELSMSERQTKLRLMVFIRENTNLEILDQGRWFCVHYPGTGDGRPPVAFRADMDAIPVEEEFSLVPYASRNPGVSHKCGHDGHSASLAAAALMLEHSGLTREIYLVFQHAEETGQGAKECTDFLLEKGISEVYSWHNFPGLPLGSLACPDTACQPASTGMILNFTGKKSHASRPEDGRNPAYAIAALISALPGITDPSNWRGLTQATVIEVHAGERAFGVSAGYGELLLTLRGEHEDEFSRLRTQVEDLAQDLAKKQGLSLRISLEDTFPATRNHPQQAAKVREAARRIGVPVTDMELFRASEDFGWFTRKIPGAIFYLGSGEDCPGLHTAEYDFPDPLIRTAADLFIELAR